MAGSSTAGDSLTPLECSSSEVKGWGIAYILNEALAAMHEATEYRTFGKEARDLLDYAANSIQACLMADPSERMRFAADAVKDLEKAVKDQADGDG